MLTICCWKWTPPRGYRSTYGPAQVHALFAMVDRHYPKPYRKVCVTDDPTGIDPSIEVIPDAGDFANVPSPHGGHNPSCYRRLRLFHPDAAQWFGDRVVSLDLDIVVTGDLAPIFERTEDLIMWGDTNPLPGSHYNGSLINLRTGTRPQVWTDFDPNSSPQRAKAAGCFGSDQGWISYCLGPGEARYTTQDGVYSYRNHLAHDHNRLPQNARIVVFHGHIDPWSSYAQQIPWVRQHYPLTTGQEGASA